MTAETAGWVTYSPLSRGLDGAAPRQLEEGRQLAKSHKYTLMDSQ